MPDNKEIVIQFQMEVAKKLKGEAANHNQYLTDDAKWHLPGSLNELCNGSDRIGKDAVLDMIESTVALFYKPETMKFDFHSMIAEDPFVHMHFTLSAETVNGKTYTSGYQTLYKLEGRKIAEAWEYFDSGTVLQLLKED